MTTQCKVLVIGSQVHIRQHLGGLEKREKNVFIKQAEFAAIGVFAAPESSLTSCRTSVFCFCGSRHSAAGTLQKYVVSLLFCQEQESFR